MGVQSVQLDTKSLGELYYNYYNPDTALRQPLGNFDNIATTYVQKAPGPAPSIRRLCLRESEEGTTPRDQAAW